MPAMENLKSFDKIFFIPLTAIALLKNKCPGTFVVRDSQSYEGAFGLAVKVDSPPIGILQHAGQDFCKCILYIQLPPNVTAICNSQLLNITRVNTSSSNVNELTS